MASGDEKKGKAKRKMRGYVMRIGGARDVSEKARKSLVEALLEEREAEEKQ